MEAMEVECCLNCTKNVPVIDIVNTACKSCCEHCKFCINRKDVTNEQLVSEEI